MLLIVTYYVIALMDCTYCILYKYQNDLQTVNEPNRTYEVHLN